MAKIVLRDGTDGARRKIITRLRSEMTHGFIGTTSEITLGSTLTTTQVRNVSSDTSERIRFFWFTSPATMFRTFNMPEDPDDNRITLFYLLNSRPVNKLVLVKPSGSNWLVNGIITFDTISPSVDIQPYYIDEIKIEVLDQV